MPQNYDARIVCEAFLQSALPVLMFALSERELASAEWLCGRPCVRQAVYVRL